MPFFILAETPAGYALFKSKDKTLHKSNNIAAEVDTAEKACSKLKLKAFQKWDSAAAALEEVAAITESKVTPMLASLLDSIKEEKKVSLAVADPKLGTAINKLPGFSITPVTDSASTEDIYRAIREHLPSLIPELTPDHINTMSLGLSHSMSRHKLKFSPDKIDTMIIQASALLDDLDKELNMYAMRLKEWYGWSFPELGKILNDNLAYARVVLAMGMRQNASKADLAEILPEEIEAAVKAAAEISMGSEISEEDLEVIKDLAEQVVEFSEYRTQLSSYLTTRMQAIAPNLTALVGELVGARLIAHAGSLMNLAKSPASTIQILGAEKALFRALKTKHDTPKYGLIYHASLVGQATGKNKGKIARMLASKAALGLRVDSLAPWGVGGEGTKLEPTDEEKAELGNNSRVKIERHLRNLEGRPIKRGVAIGPGGQQQAQPSKWEIKEARKYNPNADGLVPERPAINGHVNGDINGGRENGETSKSIEEVNGTEGEPMDDVSTSAPGAGFESGDEEEEPRSEKKPKEQRKAEKAARKAERAAVREERAIKKAKKEAKKVAKETKRDGDAEASSSKKRKHDDDVDVTEKKKKKKKKHSA